MGLVSIFTHYLRTRPRVLLLTLLYTVAVMVLLLNRFWQYEAFYYDQGLFERAIWLVSRFQTPIIDHQTLGRVHHFADHFLPSVYILFSPWYWISQRYDITLIALSLYTGLSVLVAYEIARLFIKNHFLVYSLLFAYMGYVGLQNALIFFIHDITAMLLPLTLLFLALFKEKWKWFYALLIFNLGFKETVAVIGVALAVTMWLYKKSWFKHAVIVFFISLLYGVIVTRVVIPYYSGDRFLYQPTWPTSIGQLFERMVDRPTKVQTVVYSLATFGFLPLLSPATWPLIAQDILLRFVLSYTPNSQRWDLGLHYNANLVVFLFVAAVLGSRWLEVKVRSQKFCIFWGVVVMVAVVYLHQFKLHGPFGLLYNLEFYRHTQRQGFMHDFINRIPRQGKIMTQNNLAVFFTHDDLYLLDGYEYFKQVQPAVVAFDLRTGQNPNNFWPMDEPGLTKMARQLKSEPGYQLLYEDNSRYIYTRYPVTRPTNHE